MTCPLLPHDFFALPGGGRMRYAIVEPTNPPGGQPVATVFVLPGRREFIEKKQRELQPLTDRGCRLIIVEPRGQGLSTRFLDGDLQQRDHATDFDETLHDIRRFYDAVVAPRRMGPLILSGHSLGGHLGLRWLAEGAPAFDACIVTAPMLAIWNHMAHLGAYGLSMAFTRLFGRATDYAPMQADYGPSDRVFEDNFLSHDEQMFGVLDAYFTAYPELTTGGVTWGWLAAALHSIHVMHGQGYLERISLPVLGILGGADQVTPAGELARQLDRLPRVRVVLLDGARHDLLSEAEAYRTQIWTTIDDFLTPIIGPRQP